MARVLLWSVADVMKVRTTESAFLYEVVLFVTARELKLIVWAHLADSASQQASLMNLIRRHVSLETL